MAEVPGSPTSPDRQAALDRARGWSPDTSGLAGHRASHLPLPRLESRYIYLRAVSPDDYMYLQLMESSSDLAPLWRFRGATPSPEQWMKATWEGTIAQFLVMGKKRHQPLGIVRLSDANFQDGHAQLSAAKFDQPMTPELIERIAKGTDRRRFLARAGAASLAVTAGTLGLGAGPAEAAFFEHGCDLCDSCTPACPSNVTCSWCWIGRCHTNPGGTGARHRQHCCEGFANSSGCGASCGGSWKCSYYGGVLSC